MVYELDIYLTHEMFQCQYTPRDPRGSSHTPEVAMIGYLGGISTFQEHFEDTQGQIAVSI